MLAGVREPAMRRSEKWGRGFANNDKLCEAFQQCGKLWAPERAMRVSEHASSADQRTICITHVVCGKPTSQLGREWEINYTWPILQVNFCCLWVIFFSRSLEAEGLHLPDLHARASHLSYSALVSCVLKHATRHECSRMLSWLHSCTQSYNQTPPYGHPLNSDSSFLRTSCFVLEKRKPLNIFSKFNPVNTDTPLIRTFSLAPSISVSTGI